jgi:ribonuclease VapC
VQVTRSERASSRLPRALADHTGETLTQVVVVALRERFEHERRKSRRQELIKEMTEIAERVKSMPVRDHRSARRSSATTSSERSTASRELDLLLRDTGFEVVPFDEQQVRLARRAWRRYGKGNHPAALDLGDCTSYALSKVTGEPLLFKGNDFSQTDVASVLAG